MVHNPGANSPSAVMVVFAVGQPAAGCGPATVAWMRVVAGYKVHLAELPGGSPRPSCRVSIVTSLVGMAGSAMPCP